MKFKGKPFAVEQQSTKGKRRFYICVLVQRKIAVWVAKKPDIIGLFAGDIFFVSTLWWERVKLIRTFFQVGQRKCFRTLFKIKIKLYSVII